MTDVDDLLSYLGDSPSPYHAVSSTVARLERAGYTPLTLADEWPEGGGAHYVVRGGAVMAWQDAGRDPATGFRIIGAHTDSPNLRIKPQPDTGAMGWNQIGVEVYGGALWNSWLDRDLGLSGRVVVAGPDGPREHLLLVDRPLARVPQLAVHLDRDVNGKGLKLNAQQHLTPVWGLGQWAPGDLATFIGDELDVDPAGIRGWDLMFHDVTAPARIGRNRELIASARLDNLLSCWAGTRALAAAGATSAPTPSVPLLCLFDHEEVGSTSATGADGALLAQVLERLVLARGGGREHLLRALSTSVCASVDMAHASHPNYLERHEPGHHLLVNLGPAIKVNANQRYATDASSQAVLIEACREADVPCQVFVGRNDQPCGSTIGPVTAARLGIDTVDVGVPQLSMHSARELCGAEDPVHLVATLDAFLRG